MPLEVTPRLMQNFSEHILKVYGIINGRLIEQKLEKEIQLLQKR